MKAKVPPFPVVDAPEAPAWEQRHAAAWRVFLASETGQQFKAMLNWLEQANNRAAVMRTAGSERACGFAAGWSQASAHFLHALSADVQPQSDETTDTEDASAPREPLASFP